MHASFKASRYIKSSAQTSLSSLDLLVITKDGDANLLIKIQLNSIKPNQTEHLEKLQSSLRGESNSSLTTFSWNFIISKGASLHVHSKINGKEI